MPEYCASLQRDHLIAMYEAAAREIADEAADRVAALSDAYARDHAPARRGSPPPPLGEAAHAGSSRGPAGGGGAISPVS
jgi:hypothetical protein